MIGREGCHWILLGSGWALPGYPGTAGRAIRSPGPAWVDVASVSIPHEICGKGWGQV
nr:MAG TPA: hypothetical protein [Caudoviricetes sp.]